MLIACLFSKKKELFLVSLCTNITPSKQTKGGEMKDIKGFEGIYSVTEDGKIWAHERLTKTPNGGVRHDGGKWLNQTQATKKTKHLRAYLWKEGKAFPILVHRAVAIAYIPNPENLPHINHIDCNPENNCISNLEWCDAVMNGKHAFSHGLTKPPTQIGFANSQAKLNSENIIEIRKLSQQGVKNAKIAKDFDVSPKTISDILRMKRWGHVV
jgi:hypothetical protein